MENAILTEFDIVMDDPCSSSEILDTMVAAKINNYLTSPYSSQMMTEMTDPTPTNTENAKFKWKKNTGSVVARQKLEASVEANLGESKIE